MPGPPSIFCDSIDIAVDDWCDINGCYKAGTTGRIRRRIGHELPFGSQLRSELPNPDSCSARRPVSYPRRGFHVVSADNLDERETVACCRNLSGLCNYAVKNLPKNQPSRSFIVSDDEFDGVVIAQFEFVDGEL